MKSFRPPFPKGGEVKGEEPLAPVATGETPLALLQRIEKVFRIVCAVVVVLCFLAQKRGA